MSLPALEFIAIDAVFWSKSTGAASHIFAQVTIA